MAKNQVKSKNSKNLSLVKKVGDKIQFTITRFHCTSRFQTKKIKVNTLSKRISLQCGLK